MHITRKIVGIFESGKMRILQKIERNRWCIVLLSVSCALLCCTAAAPVLAPYDPTAVDLDCVKQPPSSRHLFGTDTLGRDILSRVVYAGRTSLSIGLIATFLSLCIGLSAGLVAGYCGGVVDAILTMCIDLFLSFPSLLLAIAVSAVLPPGIAATVCALCIAGWAPFARLFRSMALSIKEHTYIDAARAVGCLPHRIIFVHVLPQCLPLIVVAASLKVGSFILAEAALSFLGIGVQPPTPAWGSMVSLYRGFLPAAPWMVLFPGLAIAGTVMVFNMLGDVLRDVVDPRLRV